MAELILASQSKYRCQLLANAGVSFDAMAAEIDERAVEASLEGSGLGGDGVAEILAVAKAQAVSEQNPGAFVIGSDQTLTLEGQLLHKPEDMEAARRRLLALSGRTHELNSAVAIVRNAETVWSYCEVSRITFRDLDPGFIGRHLAQVGDVALTSVGAYQIEGPGVQLFDRVEGDFFSIMGLPLLPLLAELRKLGLLDG